MECTFSSFFPTVFLKQYQSHHLVLPYLLVKAEIQESFICSSHVINCFFFIFYLFNHNCSSVFLSQVHDTSYNHRLNFYQICILCQRHAYGRTMGRQGCLHLLFGANPRSATLVYVPVLFSCNLRVSSFSLGSLS